MRFRGRGGNVDGLPGESTGLLEKLCFHGRIVRVGHGVVKCGKGGGDGGVTHDVILWWWPAKAPTGNNLSPNQAPVNPGQLRWLRASHGSTQCGEGREGRNAIRRRVKVEHNCPTHEQHTTEPASCQPRRG